MLDKDEIEKNPDMLGDYNIDMNYIYDIAEEGWEQHI